MIKVKETESHMAAVVSKQSVMCADDEITWFLALHCRVQGTNYTNSIGQRWSPRERP